MTDRELLIVECDACGDDVVEGVDHDCPVSGSVVSIGESRTAAAMRDSFAAKCKDRAQ